MSCVPPPQPVPQAYVPAGPGLLTASAPCLPGPVEQSLLVVARPSRPSCTRPVARKSQYEQPCGTKDHRRRCSKNEIRYGWRSATRPALRPRGDEEMVQGTFCSGQTALSTTRAAVVSSCCLVQCCCSSAVFLFGVYARDQTKASCLAVSSVAWVRDFLTVKRLALNLSVARPLQCRTVLEMRNHLEALAQSPFAAAVMISCMISPPA